LDTNNGTVIGIVNAYTLYVLSPDYKTSSGVVNGDSSTGGNLTDPGGPPLADTTKPTCLYMFPNTQVRYDFTNLVATFPAAPLVLGSAPAGSQFKSTPSGGVPGMISILPQFKQFTNRMIIALGNGFSPQAFWDPSGTPVNP